MIEILHHPICIMYYPYYHNSYSFGISGHAGFLSSTVVLSGFLEVLLVLWLSEAPNCTVRTPQTLTSRDCMRLTRVPVGCSMNPARLSKASRLFIVPPSLSYPKARPPSPAGIRCPLAHRAGRPNGLGVDLSSHSDVPHELPKGAWAPQSGPYRPP